jgi:nucleotide-binding universal stress UspA family protein
VLVEHGPPHTVIVEQARRLSAEVTVLGAYGGSGLKHLLLGSVTDRVVRHADGAVLVCRPSPANGAVIVATDFSPPARRALETGAAEGKRLGARLVLVHSVGLTAVPIPAPGMPVAALGPVPLSTREAAESRLEDELRDAGVSGSVVVLEADPATAIAELAASEPARELVIGSTGRTGLARLLLGSVAEPLVRAAPCSVLVVR